MLTKYEKICKHINVEMDDDPCEMCDFVAGKCKDCGADMVSYVGGEMWEDDLR